MSIKKPPMDLRRIDSLASSWLRNYVRTLLSDVRSTYRLAQRNHLQMMATSLAFTCVFSFFPLLIFGFSAARLALGPGAQSERELASFLETVVPNIDPGLHHSLLQLMTQNPLGNSLGLGLLAWALLELFQTLESIFGRLSSRGLDRDFVGSHLMSLVCFGVVATSSTISMALVTMKASFLRPYLGQVTPLQFVMVRSGLFILSVACVAFSITFIYKVMPTQSVRFTSALQGSILFLALFLAGRYGYDLYLRLNQTSAVQMYGGFATIILLMVWMYYLSWIFVFSAQYVIHLEEKIRRKA